MLTNTSEVMLNLRIKKSRKTKRNSLSSLPPLIKAIATMDIAHFSQIEDYKFLNFIEKYRLNQIHNIYNNSSNSQKQSMLKYIEFKAVAANENIVSLVSRKQYKQIYILLQGTVSYKYSHQNKFKQCQNSHKCGQILNNSYLPFSPFPHFSILSSSCPTILLQISIKSMLWEQISKIREEKRTQLLQIFESICKTQQKQKLMNLMQYFNQYTYYKDEIIYSKNGKQSSFNFILEGEVQICKQTQMGKPISIVNLTQYRFFYYGQNKSEWKNSSIKCKSISCKIFSIPLFIFSQIAPTQIKETFAQNQTALEVIYKRLLKKNETINKNPIKFLNLERRKRNSKSKSKSLYKCKSKSKSLYKFNKPWDLVEHFVQQLDLKSQKSLQILRRTKSAQISSRNQLPQGTSLSKSIQHLKKKVVKDNNFGIEENQSEQKLVANGFKNKLVANKSHSSYLSSIQRIKLQKQSTINRITLIKKTKFKLQRYAKGQNLYGLQDYIS